MIFARPVYHGVTLDGLEEGLHLRSLQLSGFKTFASPMTVEFSEGITAIVGANGSGKSNLVDAIRWALGEQSMREIRGRRNEDVIFSGSQQRRAASLAEVKIRFDNESRWLPIEATEAEIIRRIYRSGDSEYVINGNRVRLRDVVDVAREGGLNGGHTIVGQGMVDAVLTARPADRRRFIAAVAGVAPYEARKAEALSRLAATAQNVSEAVTLLGEIEPRLRILKRQAALAQGAITAKTELHRALAWHYASSWSRLQSERETARERLTQRRAQEEELRASLNALDDQRRRQEESFRQSQSQLQQARERVRDAEWQAEKCRATSRALRQDLSRLEETSTTLRARIQAIEDDQELTRTIEQQREQVESLSAELKTAEGELLELERRRLDLLHASEASQKEMQETARRLQANESRVSTHLAERERIQQETEKLERQAQHFVRLLPQLEGSLSEKRQEVESLRAQVELLREQRSTAMAVRDRSRKEQEGVHSLVLEASADIDRLKRGIEMLRSELEELQESRPPSTFRQVGESVHVTEDLAASLAAALGAMVEAPARPSNDAPGPRPAASPPPEWQRQVLAALEASNIAAKGWLSDLVQLDDSGDPISPSLATTLVLGPETELEPAWEAVRELESLSVDHPPLKLVDLKGNLRSAGSLYVASPTERQAVRREIEIAQAQLRVDDLQQRLNQVTVRLDGLIEQERQMSSDLERDEASFQSQSRTSAETEAALGHASALLVSYQDEVESVELRLQEINRDRDVAMGRLATLAEELVPQEDSLQLDRQRLEAARASHSTMQGQIEGLENSIRGQMNEVVVLRRRVELEVQELNRLLQRKQESVEERARLAQRIVETAQAHEEALGKLAASEAQESDARAELEEARRGLDSLPAASPQSQDSQRIEERLRALRSSIEEAVAAGERLTVEVEQLDARLEDLTRECRIDLEMDPDNVRAPEDGSIYSELDIRRLRIRAGQAEEIDPGVVAEFEALTERRDTMVAQIEDLQTASDEIEGLLRDTDREVRRRFRLAFSHVNSLFSTYFNDIFGGGSGELLLETMDGVEAVEIVTQLPGRRSRDLSSLSGGERTLVAGAFLFALISAAPPPFCVLDEVDAALDETNVDRYLGVLRQLALQTQFIVVTHNRGTMAAADFLYGIVLDQERGSRALSLRLDQAAS